jgi:hypothetical protein
VGRRGLPVVVQPGRPGAQGRRPGRAPRRAEDVQVPLSLAARRGLLRPQRLGRQEARRGGRLGPGQPRPERHGPRPPQHVLHPRSGDGRQRPAGRGRGRALPGQRHRELRHGGPADPHRGGRRAAVPRQPRFGRGPGAGRPLRVRAGCRPLRQPDLGAVGRARGRDEEGLRRPRRRAHGQALAVRRRRARGGGAAALRARGRGQPDAVHERRAGLDARRPRVPGRSRRRARGGGSSTVWTRPSRPASRPGGSPPRWACRGARGARRSISGSMRPSRRARRDGGRRAGS